MKHDFVLTPNGNYRNNLHYLRPKVEVAATAAEVTVIAGSQLQNAARKLLQVESTMGPQGALTCLALHSHALAGCTNPLPKGETIRNATKNVGK